MRLVMALGAVALSLSACGGGDDNGPSPSPDPTRLAFQVQPTTTTAGQPITPAVQVALQDASGNLVTAATNPVTLALGVNPSGATLGGTATANPVNGVATFADLAINKSGTGYTLSATSTGLTAATSAAFDATPIPGLAAAIAPSAGDGQSATVGQALATNPAVTVTDGLGDPVAGVVVTFAVDAGGGTAAGLEQTTDAAGVATVGPWTLGTTAGLNRLTATSSGLEGSPVTFTATGTAGPATAMLQNSGDNQVASLGSAVAEAPSVFVTDAFENPVVGVGVTFEVTAGGGEVTEASQVTDPDGVATVGSWRLGGTAGPNKLKATSSGLTGSPVTFSATATTFPTSVTVEVHTNFFLSVRNGSGANPGVFGSVAVDTVAVGGTVTWEWAGQQHNVTPYGNSAFTASSTQSAPATFGPIAFTAPGTYVYRCTIHSMVVDILGLVGMRGEIVVR